MTLNTGADITLTNSLVATSRFGYYFENYHDFGYPTTGVELLFNDNGGDGTCQPGQPYGDSCTADTTDTNGDALPAALAQSAGYQTRR